MVLVESGMADNLFSALEKWLGHLPGGLAIATTFASAALGTCVGSSSATAAVMTKMAYPQMKRLNYDGPLSLTAIAAAGTLAIMIPPSIPMVIYAMLAQISVTKILIAGIIPGILMAIFFSTIIVVMVKRKPSLGPTGPASPWRVRLSSLRYLLPVFAVFLILVLAISLGIATPSEAGGLGCVVALLIAAAAKKLNWGVIRRSLLETTKYAAMILLLISGITLFSKFLTYSGLAIQITNLGTLFPNPIITVILIVLAFVIMGMFIGTSGVLLIATPMFIGVIESLGFDLVLFGIIVVTMIEVGMMSPPIAENVFIVTGMVKDVSVGQIYQKLVWFILADVVLVIIFFAWPGLVLWLPNLVGG
jgi:tripartite ATP-independent transporter DctM subunit